MKLKIISRYIIQESIMYDITMDECSSKIEEIRGKFSNENYININNITNPIFPDLRRISVTNSNIDMVTNRTPNINTNLRRVYSISIILDNGSEIQVVDDFKLKDTIDLIKLNEEFLKIRKKDIEDTKLKLKQILQLYEN